MIQIGNCKIGLGQPTYVILEVARTYNGISEFEDMVAYASSQGVNAIKIQTIFVDELMQTKNISQKSQKYQNHAKYLQTLEKTLEEHQKLQQICHKYDVEFLSTPEGFRALDLLEELDVPAYKISSLNLPYTALLIEIARKNKPIILSTGMGTIDEITNALVTLRILNTQIVLMHCSSLYPTPSNKANLNNIKLLQKFNNIVGYSDHTIGTLAPILAVTLGAKVIEKHYTRDRNQDGADHKVAVDYPMLKQMMSQIRETAEMLGYTQRILSPEELTVKYIKRRKYTDGQYLQTQVM